VRMRELAVAHANAAHDHAVRALTNSADVDAH